MDPTTVLAFAARYVALTGRLAKSAEEQIRLGMTPNLLFEARPHWRVVNLGPHSAYIQAVYVELLNSRDETVVGRGLLTTGARIIVGWRNVIAPYQEIDVQQPAIDREPLLSGLARLVFYFVYGPTGPRTHALDVKIEIGTQGHDRVKHQAIRLDEAPPQLPATSIDQIQPVARS